MIKDKRMHYIKSSGGFDYYIFTPTPLGNTTMEWRNGLHIEKI